MSFTLHLSSLTRQQRYRRLQQAYGNGDLQVVRRIHTLLPCMPAHDDVQVRRRAARAGVVALLSKPVDERICDKRSDTL